MIREGAVLVKHSEKEWPADRREKKLIMMGARLRRRDCSEEQSGRWAAGVAAAEGTEASCMLGLDWEACREVGCKGYADGCAGGAGAGGYLGGL